MTTPAAPAASGNPPDQFTVERVELVAGDDIAIYYVNLFEVGHTPFDFTISAARLPAKHRPEVIAEAGPPGATGRRRGWKPAIASLRTPKSHAVSHLHIG
jgi:hypothetical protein